MNINKSLNSKVPKLIVILKRPWRKKYKSVDPGIQIIPYASKEFG